MRDKNSQILFWVWTVLAVIGAVSFVVAPNVFSALLVLGGGYGVYRDQTQNKPKFRWLEDEVREQLRITANENIHRAKYENNAQPVSFFDKLRLNFGEQWVLNLSDRQIEWMRNEYDKMIASYTGEQMELSKRRAVLEDFGGSEQRQLAAYFRGKEEQAQIESGDYNVKDGVDWDNLVDNHGKIENKENNDG